MKKTLLALAVMTAAGTANAKVELFNDAGTVATVKGQLAAYVYTADTDHKTNNALDKKVDPNVTMSGKVQFDFSHQVTDSLTAGGTFEIQNKQEFDGTETSNDAEFDDVAAYLKGDFGTVAFGEIGDVENSDNGINKDDITNELGGDYLIPTLSDSKGNGISYSNTISNLTLIVDAYTAADENTDNSYGFGANYVGDMYSVGAMYQVKGAVNNGNDLKVMAISADVTVLESLTLAATYGQTEFVISILIQSVHLLLMRWAMQLFTELTQCTIATNSLTMHLSMF
jgi:predicted porin